MKCVSLALIPLLAATFIQAAHAQSQDKPKDRGTLQSVKDRGSLSCGVSQGLPGFSAPDDKGNWTGLDVDVCRAIAAAIFNDPTKVKFVPLSAKDRFTALQSGEIDVLSRNSTWTLSRDTSLGLNYTGISYYDGQGFLVRKSLKVNSALELNSASICVQTNTTSELNLADFFRKMITDSSVNIPSASTLSRARFFWIWVSSCIQVSYRISHVRVPAICKNPKNSNYL